MNWNEFAGQNGKRFLLGYLAVWALSVAYLAARGADWVFPIFSLLIFGGLLASLGWWLTRRSAAPPVEVRNPARQGPAVLVYLALYAFVLIGWGLGAVKEAFAPGLAQEIAELIYKLAIHVALPAALIVMLGGVLRDTFDPGLRRKGVIPALVIYCAVLFGLLALVSPSLRNLDAAGVQGSAIIGWTLLSWLWVSVEAGLCEEFLFRAVVQSRLTAWLASPLGAICVTAVLFALVHWPGLYLRGGPDTDGWSTDPLQVAAFTIATLSPLALTFGVLWARTRSLVLIVLIHGAVDALPHAADMARIWG